MVKKKKPKKKKFTKERKVEKELLWIIGFIVLLVIVFFVVSTIFKSFNSFDYNGLAFTKEKLGDILLYHHYYYFTGNDGGLIKYNFYLRNDPRENNVSLEGDKIVYDGGFAIYISIDPTSLQQCRQGVLAVGDLTSFLVDNQLFVIGGNLDFWDAGLKRQDWITCENRPQNIVIEINNGTETKINIDGLCHQITISNCEMLESTERYKTQAVIDAKASDSS